MYSTYTEYALITDDADRGLVAQLEPLFVAVKAAKGSGRQMSTLAECAVQAGMTRKTFQNRYYAWLKNGVMGVADKRKIAKARRVPDILGVFKSYCEQNKESCSGAHRQMMRDFRMGRLMPGIGTWREVYYRRDPHALRCRHAPSASGRLGSSVGRRLGKCPRYFEGL